MVSAVIYGVAILGAAFLLNWGAEAAEKEAPAEAPEEKEAPADAPAEAP